MCVPLWTFFLELNKIMMCRKHKTRQPNHFPVSFVNRYMHIYKNGKSEILCQVWTKLFRSFSTRAWKHFNIQLFLKRTHFNVRAWRTKFNQGFNQWELIRNYPKIELNFRLLFRVTSCTVIINKLHDKLAQHGWALAKASQSWQEQNWVPLKSHFWQRADMEWSSAHIQY